MKKSIGFSNGVYNADSAKSTFNPFSQEFRFS